MRIWSAWISCKKKSRFRCDGRHSKTGTRSLSTDSTANKNLNLEMSCRISVPFRTSRYATMLLNASEGMIFRDSRFCKEQMNIVRGMLPPTQQKRVTTFELLRVTTMTMSFALRNEQVFRRSEHRPSRCSPPRVSL